MNTVAATPLTVCGIDTATISTAAKAVGNVALGGIEMIAGYTGMVGAKALHVVADRVATTSEGLWVDGAQKINGLAIAQMYLDTLDEF